MAGAVVRYTCQNIGGMIDSAVIADADGKYTIRGIATDDFQVQMDDKTTMKSGGGSVVATTTDGSSGAATFNVKPGETVTKDLQLAKGLELSGKVVDADTGEPLPGIELYAYANTGGSFRPNMLTHGCTGTFSYDCPFRGSSLHPVPAIPRWQLPDRSAMAANLAKTRSNRSMSE